MALRLSAQPRSRLAIAAQIPSGRFGSGYFQETDPKHLFAANAAILRTGVGAEQMPRVLEIAMQTAISKSGVAVIAIPAMSRLSMPSLTARVYTFPEPTPAVCPSAEELNLLADLLIGQTRSLFWAVRVAPELMRIGRISQQT